VTLPPARPLLAPPQVATPTIVRPLGATVAPFLSPADQFHLSSFYVTTTSTAALTATTIPSDFHPYQ